MRSMITTSLAALAAALAATATFAQTDDTAPVPPRAERERGEISKVGPPPIGDSSAMSEEKPLPRDEARKAAERAEDAARAKSSE